MTRPFHIFAPLLIAAIVILVWEGSVRAYDISRFLLPPPSAILMALIGNAGPLAMAALYTLKITMTALLLAIVSGMSIAVLFSQSRMLELALFPYAVILQVTPIVAIAPLVLIWVGIDHVERALVVIAWLVAFFPIVANMTLGFKSVDPRLSDLFRLYGASRRQRFIRLLLPSSLPYLLAGIKISAGLALIGAVVAEFVAGSGGSTGLAWTILEAGNRLAVDRMFAALLVLSGIGIAQFYLLSALEHRLLARWHPSSV